MLISYTYVILSKLVLSGILAKSIEKVFLIFVFLFKIKSLSHGYLPWQRVSPLHYTYVCMIIHIIVNTTIRHVCFK